MALPPVPASNIRHCPGLPGYAVSDRGDVWSCRATGRPYRNQRRRPWGRWRQLHPSPHYPTSRYLAVGVHDGGIQRAYLVHRLVLLAFVGPCPRGRHACHNNGRGSDNRLSNLRWDTPASNMADRNRHGTYCGSATWNARLTEPQVRTIRRRYNGGRSGISQKSLARQFGVCQTSIGFIVRGRSWRHVSLSRSR